MWIFTPDGFYSVVTAEEFGHELQVRARCGADLDRLRAGTFPEQGEGVTVPGRDYPWWAFTTRADLAACLGRLVRAIGYGNFKAEVERRQGHGRAGIYHDVWRDCLQIEREAGRA